MERFDDLKLTGVQLGKDHLVIISGGAAHIGAVSLAFPAADGSCPVQTSAVPGHKEHTLTGAFSARISQELGAAASVVMGIHYEDLTPGDIREISRRAEELVEDYILKYKRKPI